jgi:hypothetical protein
VLSSCYHQRRELGRGSGEPQSLGSIIPEEYLQFYSEAKSEILFWMPYVDSSKLVQAQLVSEHNILEPTRGLLSSTVALGVTPQSYFLQN